jgi:hypothetical protein
MFTQKRSSRLMWSRGCNKTTSEMRGLLPQDWLGNSRRGENIQIHTQHKDTITYVMVKLLQLKFIDYNTEQWNVFQKIECLRKSVHHDRHKGIHLILEVKTFIDNLHLRHVPVRSPALRSLDLPLITVIGIVGRERGITCIQEINKPKLERLRLERLIRHDQAVDFYTYKGSKRKTDSLTYNN